jgi:23S rRNA pseudouridine1911/1915/1917 synthase
MSITIPEKWNKLSIEEIFKENWKLPKKLMHEWRMSKKVRVNSEIILWTTPLATGSILTIPIFEHAGTDTVIPKNLKINILFEDDFLLVANKPSGMDTHPSEPQQTDALLNGVAYHLKASGQTSMIKHIHRLDKDTTGAVLFAKTRLTGSMLDRMLEERKIKRTYAALVEGIIREEKGTINEKIGRDRHHASRRRVSPSGQSAVTHFKVIKKFPKENKTLITCELESGRTHQIRVHLSHMGHPLAGDVLYGGKPVYPRQALHAFKIEFSHPITEELIKVSAPFLDIPEIFPAGTL